ncbi:MAG: glycosyltransferase family 4 protein, partial [Gemmatimonadetes bacterium]
MRRVLIISHAYLSAANRGKLRALASRGVDVTVGVPQRWRDPVLGATTEIAWERQNGVEVFPIPARRHGEAQLLKFGGRALHA